jgi:hypothetical protein
MHKRIPLFFLLVSLLLLGCQDDDQIMVNPGTVPEARALALNGTVGTTDYVIFSNGRRGILTAFQRELEGSSLDFTALDNGRTQEILQDETGTVYDIFGQGRGGENDGHLLKAIPQGTAFWLVYGGLFPGAPLDDESMVLPDTLELRYNATYDIPINSLYTGAGFGIIATLDNPEFVDYNRRTEDTPEGIEEDDILVGVSLNGDTRLYPAPILAAHEIVNDVVGGIPIAITYSPLSGSARVWRSPETAGNPLGVTGMLANSTMLMFDRTEEANRYHQITGRCVAGLCRDQYLEPINYLATSWEHWRNLISEVKILVPSPSIDVDRARRMDARIKATVPHGFPVDFFDARLPEKEITFGVTDGRTGEMFSLEQFQ